LDGNYLVILNEQGEIKKNFTKSEPQPDPQPQPELQPNFDQIYNRDAKLPQNMAEEHLTLGQDDGFIYCQKWNELFCSCTLNGHFYFYKVDNEKLENDEIVLQFDIFQIFQEYNQCPTSLNQKTRPIIPSTYSHWTSKSIHSCLS
jgi:hypothetical protein